jgi:hypothetical protein
MPGTSITVSTRHSPAPLIRPELLDPVAARSGNRKMLRNLTATTAKRFVWRLCYWGGLAAVFAWAVWLRFRLPLDPIADPDTWAYLSPALWKLIGGGFEHMPYGRNFVYPGFLYLLLRFFGDFRAITVAQHLLGLLAGGILMLTWQHTRGFLASPRVPPAVHKALGLVAVAAFLSASGPIYLEMQLRPEAVAVFLVSVNLNLVIQFGACCFVENRQTAAVIYGLTTILSSLLLADVKPSFVLVAIVAILPVGMFFFRRGLLWQKMALGGGAAVGAALLLLPEHFFSRSDAVSKCYLPTQLFAIHANLIRDQIGDDLERNARVPYPVEWLAHVHSALSAEITKSIAAGAVHFRTLGFDPDYLMHDRSSIAAQLQKEFGDNPSALSAFYWFYYWRIWRQRPSLMIKKIVREMAIFYVPNCPAYRLGKFLSLADKYVGGVTSLNNELYRKVWTAYPPAVDFIRRTESLTRSAPVVQQPAYIRRPLGLLAATYLPLLLIALALSALVFIQERYRRGLGWLAALALFVYSYNLASCLEVAVIHSLQNPRYLSVQVLFTIFAQFLALWFLIEFVLKTGHSPKTLLV